MNLLPAKDNWKSFLGCLLVPSIGVPGIIGLMAKSGAQAVAFGLLAAYVSLPFLFANLLGVRNHSLGGTYKSALFEGFIGIGPTVPWGWIYCIAFWSVAGYVIWLLFVAIKNGIKRNGT